jgi:indolepyruvate ferredoxin oxidoreductase alpha subunit
MLIVGEDYGEGSSIMQERSHAFAMKSQVWLLDPRPNLPSIVNAVEKGFELSEASNTPVMLELRIRACHVHGHFPTKDNVRPAFTLKDAIEHPKRDVNRIVLPPSSYLHEQEKIKDRWPAAVKFIQEHQINEFFSSSAKDFGIVLQGGMYNGVLRALEVLGLADAFGESKIPLYVLNVTYPLVDDEFKTFCTGKRGLLIVEEGQPDFIEQNIHAILRKADLQTRVHGKEFLPMAGEYTGGVILQGVKSFVERYAPELLSESSNSVPAVQSTALMIQAVADATAQVLPRPPSFCTGCPERPIFTAIKLLEKELGPRHISCDIGCHLFSILPPFNIGATTMGYGLGWAGASAFNTPETEHRTMAIMGDGGFWHNGLTSGVGNAVFNQTDNVLLVVDNGYSAATGGQDVLSSKAINPIRSTNNPIEKAVKGVGVDWVKTVTHTYNLDQMRGALRDALTTQTKGPKVVVAQSECMLNRQRRVKPQIKQRIKQGERVVREKFGVDPDTCTGDHSCIRLSGCPSLSIKTNPDPLRTDPVVAVADSCVGCGLCGEVAHAAVLCPSFYRAEIINNPSGWDRFKEKIRHWVIGRLQNRIERRLEGISVAG